MHRYPLSPRHARQRNRPFVPIAGRSSRSSLILGALLLAGSTLGVIATTNTSPTITNLSLSASVIDEGQEVTVTGAFTDPDDTDTHTVQLDWREPNLDQQKVVLAPGQKSFQVTHKFKDNQYPSPIRVSIIDHQPGVDPNDNTGGVGADWEYLPLTVNNVAPTFAKGVEVKKFALQPGKVVIEGNVVDPGADTLQVTAAWGSSQQFPGLGSSPCSLVKGHFRCEYTYPSTPRTYTATVRVQDEDGGHNTHNLRIQIP